jgi:predicted nucleic acid-binding protein
MVGTNVLFDTNILIDYLSGVVEARAELERYPDRAISVITWMEVMAGSTPGDEAQIRAFLMTFLNLSITAAAAERAVVLRRKWRIKLPDAIIQATAEVGDRLLITRNTRDFPSGVPGVRVPYQI